MFTLLTLVLGVRVQPETFSNFEASKSMFEIIPLLIDSLVR